MCSVLALAFGDAWAGCVTSKTPATRVVVKGTERCTCPYQLLLGNGAKLSASENNDFEVIHHN